MKHTPIYTALLLAMPLCHAQETTAATPETSAIVEAAATPEEELLNQVIPLLRDLEAVHDRATADAIAARMIEFEHLYEVALMSDNFDDDVFEDLLENSGITEDYMAELFNRLREHDFYGSEAMKTLIDAPGEERDSSAEEEISAETPSVELLEEIGREFSKAVAEKGLAVSGGPGLTMGTAWVMTSGTADDVHLQYDILSCLPNWKSEYQYFTIGEQEDCVYDAQAGHITYKDKTYALTIYFDISKYWDNRRAEYEDDFSADTPAKTYTPEEQQAAITEGISIIKEVNSILKTVHNKESADAAAEALKPLRTRAEELDDIIQSVEDELLEQLDKALLMEVDDINDALDDKNYYGSDALRNIMR